MISSGYVSRVQGTMDYIRLIPGHRPIISGYMTRKTEGYRYIRPLYQGTGKETDFRPLSGYETKQGYISGFFCSLDYIRLLSLFPSGSGYISGYISGLSIRLFRFLPSFLPSGKQKQKEQKEQGKTETDTETKKTNKKLKKM